MTHPTQGAEALRDYLSQPDRSQSELARELGISQPSVSAWLRGHSRPDPHHRTALEVLASIPAASWETDEERSLVERLRARTAEPTIERDGYDQTEGA